MCLEAEQGGLLEIVLSVRGQMTDLGKEFVGGGLEGEGNYVVMVL